MVAPAKPRVKLSLAHCQRNLVHAGYDSSKTTYENRRHWANADNLSANAGQTSSVRATIRNRSRYEDANNGYARGIAKTFVNYVIGKGPSLQMTLPNAEDNRQIEKLFKRWSKRVKMGRKLRTARKSQMVSGEAFIAIVNNPRIKGPIKLDLKLIECDRVTSQIGQYDADPQYIDGIRYDEHGNPIEYTVLKYHPGDTASVARSSLNDYKFIKAEYMIHLYDWDRPEQSRGVSELASSLPLFAQSRRYTLAALSSAENAASIGGMLYSDSIADDDEDADSVEVFDEFELERNTNLTLPRGYKYQQLKSEQPTTMYPAFKRELLKEIGRPIGMPYNIAASDSSDYNYSSGRLDHQSFDKLISIERDDIEIEAIDRILERWFDEAVLITDYLPQSARAVDACEEHQWFWPGLEDVDQVKAANAQEKRLKNRTTTLAAEYAAKGQDWEQELRQLAKEKKLMEKLGLTTEDAAPDSSNTNKDEVEDVA